MCWLSCIQLSIFARGRQSHKSHAHSKPSQQLHHALSSEAKQYEREIAMAFARIRCLLAVNSAVRQTVRYVRTYFCCMTSSPIIAWVKGYPATLRGQNQARILHTSFLCITIGVSVETVFILIFCLTSDKQKKFQICTCKIVTVHVYAESFKAFVHVCMILLLF